MKDIKLKIGYKKWILLFCAFFAFISAFLIYMNNANQTPLLLFTAFVGSLIITLSIIGIFNFSQRMVLLTDDRIIKVGFSEKLIPYAEIRKFGLGPEGLLFMGIIVTSTLRLCNQILIWQKNVYSI